MDELDHGRTHKKLEAAARYWARGEKLDGDDAEDDLTAFGVALADTDGWFESDDQPEDFYLWEENSQALDLFLSMQSQWIILAGMGGAYYQGINYVALPAVMDFLQIGPDDRTKLFRDMQAMEFAAIPIRNGDKPARPTEDMA